MTDALRHGADLFNGGQFWEAHEAWEQLWLEAEGVDKLFLQGLIQLAAAYHKAFVQAQPRGCVMLLEAALQKLVPAPEDHLGVRTAPILNRAWLNLDRAKRWRDGLEGPLSREEIAHVELLA
jgi:predicted metal-dependent hydrolase